jgi:hypothetical protein
MRQAPLLSRATLDGLLLRVPCRRAALEAELADLGPLRLTSTPAATRDTCALHLEMWRVRGGAVQLGPLDQHAWSERLGVAFASMLGVAALGPGALARCEKAFGAMSRGATRSLATYSELMLAVPGVVVDGEDDRPHCLVLGMVTDSAIARWADAALGFGYQKRAGSFRIDDSAAGGEWSVTLEGAGPLLTVVTHDATTGSESFPEIDDVFRQPLLGVTERRRLVASSLRRTLSQPGARAHAIPARLRVQGGSLGGLLAGTHDLAAYGSRSTWGAIRFANLEAHVSLPYAL